MLECNVTWKQKNYDNKTKHDKIKPSRDTAYENCEVKRTKSFALTFES